MSHIFGPFQFYTRKILYPRYFSSVACAPRKVIRRHMTSDFDVCALDLDMQMSFLNAAPCPDVLFTVLTAVRDVCVCGFGVYIMCLPNEKKLYSDVGQMNGNTCATKIGLLYHIRIVFGSDSCLRKHGLFLPLCLRL